MRVQILYFESCPHHRPTVRLTHEVIAACGVAAEVEEVEVRNQNEAERLRFLGSPSVRVDGVDIEPETTARGNFALSCRMYEGSGVPPRDLLVRALGQRRPTGSSIAFNDVLKAWTATYDGLSQDEIDRRILGFSTIVRGIAERGSVSPAAFGASADLSPEQVSELFRGLAASGHELDADGNLVGAALSVRRTPHRFRVAEKELYAWCALDALFLPGLLDETAEVQSRCPMTDAAIRLVVSPRGIEERAPDSAVLSVVVPGGSGFVQTGPASPT